MKLTGPIGVAICGALVFASVASAQRAASQLPGTQEDKVGVAVALTAGGTAFQVNGQGRCTHEPGASIYAVRAQQWRVEQSDGTRSVTLTFWRPANGSGDMFTLHVSHGRQSYVTSTVKVGDQGDPKGSGKMTFEPAGKGGNFTVNAIAGNGTKISGTIKCSAFTALMAVAGN